MKKPNQIDEEARVAQETRDRLEDATLRSASLLEALAALLELSEKSDHPQLSDSSVEGLKRIAFQEGENLRESFENYLHLLAKGRMIAA